MGNYESWEEFEAKLREHTEQRKKDALENRAKDKMLEELIARFQFPVPESFVQQQIDARLDRGLRALAQQGMTPEEMRKLDFGRLREAQRDQAINEVKASMILDQIAEAEDVEVSDDELRPRAADAVDPIARAAGDVAGALVEGWRVWTAFASRCGEKYRQRAVREAGVVS